MPFQEILILTALIIWTVIGAGLIVALLAVGPAGSADAQGN